jgi:hypothetical protein
MIDGKTEQLFYDYCFDIPSSSIMKTMQAKTSFFSSWYGANVLPTALYLHLHSSISTSEKYYEEIIINGNILKFIIDNEQLEAA